MNISELGDKKKTTNQQLSDHLIFALLMKQARLQHEFSKFKKKMDLITVFFYTKNKHPLTVFLFFLRFQKEYLDHSESVLQPNPVRPL